MSERSIEDRLREEYFALLPDTRQIADELETEVRHCLLPLSCKLHRYEKIEVSSRVKDCESALGALRRRQEGATFDSDRADSYTLTTLNDLAGVRVLAFPRSRWIEAESILRRHADIAKWTSDPVPSDDAASEPLAYKYYGYCSRSRRLRAELQHVTMLIGLIWQVEHSAIYKPAPELKGVLASLEMRQPTNDVYKALRLFEGWFERLVGRDPQK